MSETKRYPSADGSCVLEVRNDAAYVLDSEGRELTRIEYSAECVAAAISISQSHAAFALRTLLMTYTYVLTKAKQWQKEGVGKPTTTPPASLRFEEPADPRYPPLALIRTSKDGTEEVLWPRT